MSETAGSDLIRCFIALLPPADVQTYADQVIQTLSQRYRTRTAHVPPHITLQPPFLWPSTDLPALEAELASFAQSHPPIPIQLLGFGAFAPRVLYIHVVPSSELMAQQAALQQRLQTQLNICDSHRSFVPHLTVASRHFTHQTFRQAWSEWRGKTVEFEFVMHQLTLLIYQDRQWHVQTEFLLRSTD